MNTIFLGIFPPDISKTLLPIIVAGIIGFLLCYAHRYLAFIVLPASLGFWIYLIKFLEFFTNLLSGYMLIVYLTMALALVAMLIGTRLSWKKHYAKFSKLK